MEITYRHKAGRARNGDRVGQVVHIVRPGNGNFAPAICGNEPGIYGQGWSVWHDDSPTCEKCLKIFNETPTKEIKP